MRLYQAVQSFWCDVMCCHRILSLGNLWNGFIVALVLFFLYSIVDQVFFRSHGTF